jgi:hypothetical protein
LNQSLFRSPDRRADEVLSGMDLESALGGRDSARRHYQNC